MVNWDAIGAIGEIAGAAGVIVTLLYLSVQLRQSTKTSRITAIQSSMENSAQFSEILLADDEVARLFWLGLANPEELDDAGKRKFIAALNIFMRRESVAFYLETAADTLPKDFRAFIVGISKTETTMNDAAKALLVGGDS